jgi:Mn-dependent DtxR family transcriptional regulator
VESILKEFENKGLIYLSNIGYYDTTEKGRKIMLELLDGK